MKVPVAIATAKETNKTAIKRVEKKIEPRTESILLSIVVEIRFLKGRAKVRKNVSMTVFNDQIKS